MADASPRGGPKTPIISGGALPASDSTASTEPFSPTFSTGAAVTSEFDLVETSTRSDPAKQKEFERNQQALDKQQERIQRNREHIFFLCQRGVVMVFGFVILAAVLIFAGGILRDKSSSAEAREQAYAFWGLVAGGVVSALFGILKPKS